MPSFTLLYFFIGITNSLLYSYFILPMKKNTPPKINPTIYPIMYQGMIILPYTNKKAIHIHHWILYCIICFSYCFYNIPIIVIGFSSGLFIQGLTYNDRFSFICENPYILSTVAQRKRARLITLRS